MTRHFPKISGNVYALLVILAVLIALGLNVLADTPPAHSRCTSYHTLSGEFGNGCP